MPSSTSQNFCCQCPCPLSEAQPPPASAGDPPTLAGKSGSASYGVTAPSPGPDGHTILCVPSKSGVPVSPRPVKVLQSNPSSLQNLILWKFLLPLLDPQVGKPDVGLRTFTPVGGLLWYICSSVCESPTQGLWDLIFIVIAPLLPSHCSFSFVFGCGISFLVSCSVFLSITVQQLVVILVLSQEGVSARPSTLPS